jgi:hypothetical protein
MSEGWKVVFSDLGRKVLQAAVVVVVEEVIRRNVQAYPEYQDQNKYRSKKERVTD